MTINKTQCQTIPQVDVYLPEHVFFHRQLYVYSSNQIHLQRTNTTFTKKKKIVTNKYFYDKDIINDDGNS